MMEGGMETSKFIFSYKKVKEKVLKNYTNRKITKMVSQQCAMKDMGK